MKIAAIPRNPSHSPNMADRDREILLSIATKLQEKGHDVHILEERDCYALDCYDALYHMSRTPDILSKIKEVDKKATNCVTAVENCSRKRFMQLLSEAGILQPHYIVTATNTTVPQLEYPLWIKKADGWSLHPNDVQFVSNESEAAKALDEHLARGNKEVICCKHITGDIVKFYGVKNNFFHWQYPSPEKSKFGLEKINGETRNTPFKEDTLRINAQKAAEAIGVEIFGGDAIIAPDGKIYIIDINDFPSFSCCRERASEAISNHIISKFNV